MREEREEEGGEGVGRTYPEQVNSMLDALSLKTRDAGYPDHRPFINIYLK